LTAPARLVTLEPGECFALTDRQHWGGDVSTAAPNTPSNGGSIALRFLLLAPPRDAQRLSAGLAAGSGTNAPTIECTDDLESARAALTHGEWSAVISVWPLAAASALEDAPASLPRVLVCDQINDDALCASQRFGAILCDMERSAEQLRVALRHLARAAVERTHERERKEFDAEQLGILEQVSSGAALGAILERIVLLIERFKFGLCTILLIDPKSGTIWHGAAPSLPSSFIGAIDGQRIGPTAGSCGAAAYSGETVFVHDIASHPFWEDWRALALPLGLRACWSSPILSPEREVLGTFAVYYREPRHPSPLELARVASATHLAAVAIARERNARLLRGSEQRERQLLETSFEGVLMLDLDGRITFANERAATMLGFARSELPGRCFADLTHPSERSRVAEALDSRKGGSSGQYELRMRTSAGGDLWTIVAGSAVLGASGEVVGTLKMITDISERMLAERALQQSELELRTIFESTVMGVALVDASSRPVRYNSALARISGYGFEELRQTPLMSLVHPDDLETVAQIERAFDRGERNEPSRELRLVRKSGEVIWVRAHASPFTSDARTALQGVVVVDDVSESKRLEQALRAEERLLALIYQHVTDVVCYLAVEPDQRYRFVSVNRAFCLTLAVEPHEVIGKLLEDVLWMVPLESVRAHYGQAIEQRSSVRWEEAGYFATHTEYAEVIATPVFDRSGRCTNLVITSRSITERKRAEAKIAEQAALLDRARDAIMVRSLDHVVRYWNESAERLYGYRREEAESRSVLSLIYGETGAFEEAERKLLERGEFTGELRQRTKSGREIVVDSSWTLLRDDAGRPESVLVINSDVTEKKKLELQVMLAQRMEGLGTLAGGIAHDFNNILAAIRGYLELTLIALPEQSSARRSLEIVRSATDRAVELVKRILAFSRHQAAQREPCMLDGVVQEVVQLLRATLPRSIEIEADFAAGGFEVLADPSQIHQIVMNLGTNAAHALQNRGTIYLRLAPIELHEPLIGVSSNVAPGFYMRLTVADDGCGIAPEIIDRIFDPFFTTKGAGVGTGLGLSVVLGIVKDHAGTLCVSSAPGRGTAFDIYLPMATPTKPTSLPPPPPKPMRGQGERLLCVDDEEWLLALEQTFLEALGYTVEAYANPREALRAFSARPDAFAALATDLSMPDMSGIELATAVHRLRPALPIILSSGHLTPERRQEAGHAGVAAIIAKPDYLEPLAHALVRLLRTSTRARDAS
jgi:PAS domain S-box-containing protein